MDDQDPQDKAELFDEEVVGTEEPDGIDGSSSPDDSDDPVVAALDREAALLELEEHAHHASDHPGLDPETLELAEKAHLDELPTDLAALEARDARGGPDQADHGVDVEQLADESTEE